MEKRILLIVNPKAGRERHREELAGVVDILCASGAFVTVCTTMHQGHARQIAATHGKQYDIVACFGGDGTLGETIAGLMTLPVRPPVGYIPMGTTNDMAQTLGIPKHAEAAARVIMQGNPAPVDVGQFDNDYFTYIAAFGAFTEVAYETPPETKKMFGHFAYVLEGMGRLSKLSPQNLTVEYDGNKIEGEFIFGAVTNTTSIAGVLKLKEDHVDLSDGAFEVILVKRPQNLIDLHHTFMNIMITQKFQSDHVRLIHAKEVRFLFDEPVSWTKDGEAGGSHTDVTLKTIQPGVQIFVP